MVHVSAAAGSVEIWNGDRRLAVHPRATRPGQRLTLPGQWDGLPIRSGHGRPRAIARQLAPSEVEHRSLDVYEHIALGGKA